MDTSTPVIDRLLVMNDETRGEAALLAQLFWAVLGLEYNVLGLKDYRTGVEPPPGVPVTPCLDHEAQITSTVPPHVGGYVQHRRTGRILGVVYTPLKRRVDVEEEGRAAADLDELSELADYLSSRFRRHRVRVHRLRAGSATLRARDAAEAHIELATVLTGDDPDAIVAALDRLAGISTLMEKESRVTSWGMRTAYAPLMAAVAFVLVMLFPGPLDDFSAYTAGDFARLGLLVLLGGAFLYYGLKAVQLTKTATRLNKRIQEYRFITAARSRLAAPGDDDGHEAPARRSESVARVRELLGAEPDERSVVAGLVAARHRSATRALGQRSAGTRTPLCGAIDALRRERIAQQIGRSEACLDAVAADSGDPACVAERARLEAELAGLRSRLVLLAG